MARTNKVDDAFSSGVLSCLAVVHSYGDTGSHMFNDMLNMAGREKIIAFARKNDEMEWSGLCAHLALDQESPQ